MAPWVPNIEYRSNIGDTLKSRPFRVSRGRFCAWSFRGPPRLRVVPTLFLIQAQRWLRASPVNPVFSFQCSVLSGETVAAAIFGLRGLVTAFFFRR